MDSLWFYIFTGLVLGLTSGLTPGALSALIISESLSRGARAGAAMAFAPLFTDGIALSLAVWGLGPWLKQPGVLGLLSLAGAVYLLGLGLPLIVRPAAPAPASAVAGSALLRAIAVNALNPNLYLFWLTVGTPTVLQAWQGRPAWAAAFLLSFWALLVGSMAGIALIVSRTRHWLQGSRYLWALRILGALLAAYAAVFAVRGLAALRMV